jgi:amphi-Trp domain-containing protein
MELIEVTDKQRLGREEAAARLRELADHLARHNDIEYERGGERFRAHVPDEVQFKFEFEIEDGETELEIELSW